MAAFLRASPSSERPAPRPVMASGSQPSSTLATALAVVVLPMPISPVAKRLTSCSLQSFSSSAPARMACSRVMAEPFEISPVPLATRRFSTPGCGLKSLMPISTGISLQFARRAIRQAWCLPQIRGPPWPSPRCRSGSRPWATTPLSAQKINRAFLFRSMSTEPVTDAIWHSASSRRPRLPSGFAQAFQRWRVSCSAASFFRLDLFQQLCQCHACSSSRSTPAPAKCANRIPAAYVYVSDQGTKYHRDPDCSGMIDPDRIALEDARSMGFAPCQKCY